MARKPAPRVRALLELFRPVVDEIVLAADRTGDPATLEACAALADKRFAIDPAPLNRRLGWLQEQCESDWIFRFDDDEVPSSDLLASLRTLVESHGPMQIGLPRRWLLGGPDAWIAEHPWTPDYQVRILRNAPGAWRYPALLHAPIEVLGELRLVDHPLYHCELLLAGVDERRKKRAEYESRRPGLRNGDFAVNWYYTPEDCGEVETAPTPPEDLALIELVGSEALRTNGAAARAPVVPAQERDAERFNATREVSEGAYKARIEVVRAPGRTSAGSTRQLEVLVTNLGDEFWPWGEYPPFIRLGYRWRAPSGESVSHGRCFFTETVRPGATTRMLALVLAPTEPGPYQLELDVIHEDVCWFEQPAVLAVEVR